MEWVETTGRTIAEALDTALDQLGVDEDEVDYEVLIEPKAGLFGRFGGTEARIRARVKPISREKPGDRRRRGRKTGRGNDRGGPRAREPRSTAPEEPTQAPAAIGGPRPEGAERSSTTNNGTGRRRRRGSQARQEGTTVEQQVDVPIEEQASTSVEFVRGLVESFGVTARVEARIEEGDTIIVEAEGDDLGLLVGQRGATLSAIEELVRTVLQRHTGGHGARIHVDVGGYRARRREALEAFTRQLIDRVVETGREQVLEPMSASDRKVVHDVAAEVEGVATASEGEEPRRRVVIRKT